MALLDLTAKNPANANVISKYDYPKFPPPHIHGATSAPWLWMDLEDDIDTEQFKNPLASTPDLCPHDSSCNDCWIGYPQSLFPNWTNLQTAKSRIQQAITNDETCTLYQIDISTRGFFADVAPIVAEHDKETEVWQTLVSEKRSSDIRVRVLIIENMSGPILQMLGTKYNMDPIFWSSSLNWIPSHSQRLLPGVGDHTIITLTFLKSTSVIKWTPTDEPFVSFSPTEKLGTQLLDMQTPLMLYSMGTTHALALDLLSLYLVRDINGGGTIISYHPTLYQPITTASSLHARIRCAGQSVHWQNIFRRSSDPLFILLPFLWHVLYSWDRALGILYNHICFMESRVLRVSDICLAQEFHTVRAHYLQYTPLLDDFDKHVKFLMDTSNPMQSSFSEEDWAISHAMLRKECESLSNEIYRLKGQVQLQEGRLANAVALAFTSTNLTDSRLMREMTSAAVRDSHGITYSLRDPLTAI